MKILTVTTREIENLKRAAATTENYYTGSKCEVKIRENSIFVDCIVTVEPNMEINVVYAFLSGFYLGFSEGKLV
jgi:hypothetical protein